MFGCSGILVPEEKGLLEQLKTMKVGQVWVLEELVKGWFMAVTLGQIEGKCLLRRWGTAWLLDR